MDDSLGTPGVSPGYGFRGIMGSIIACHLAAPAPHAHVPLGLSTVLGHLVFATTGASQDELRIVLESRNIAEH